MFRITKDHIDDGRMNDRIFVEEFILIGGHVKKTTGSTLVIPNEYPEDVKEFDDAAKTEFRLFDDDGNLYFDGLMTTAQLNGTEDEAFEPLDAFGAAYGCTELMYKENGEWKKL